jgi:hypothetical protein
MSLFDKTVNMLNGINGVGSSSLGGKLLQTGMAYGAASLSKKYGSKTANIAKSAASAISLGVTGDWQGAIQQMVNGGLLSQISPELDLMTSGERYAQTPNYLLGGITPRELHTIYLDHVNLGIARKNVFLVVFVDNASKRVGSAASNIGGSSSVITSAASRVADYALKNLFEQSLSSSLGFSLNMFVTDISMSNMTNLSGNTHQVGAGTIDAPNSASLTDISMTTYDDENGTIKKLFGALATKTIHQDGTVGLPCDYEFGIRVIPAFTSEQASQGLMGAILGNAAMQGRPLEFNVRFESIDVEYSRSANEPETVRINLKQTDTFRDF